MSDDLVKRLRDLGDHAAYEPNMHHTAADFIEMLKEDLTMAAVNVYELEAKLSKSEALLAKAVEALQWCSGSADFNDGGIAREGWLKLCAPLIAELKERIGDE